MGYFDLKANCAICNKNLDLFSFKSRLQLKDGWICGNCIKKTGGFAAIKRNKTTVDEVKKKLFTVAKKEVVEIKEENDLLLEKEVEIDECNIYKDNITRIIDVSKEDIELYDGLSNKEIKEELESYIDRIDEIGEIEDQGTPDIKLFFNETKTLKYISVKMYHKEFDKFLTVGKVPKDLEKQIIPLLDKNILIWGSFIGGKFKTLEDDKIKTIKKPISIKVLVKIFDH